MLLSCLFWRGDSVLFNNMHNSAPYCITENMDCSKFVNGGEVLRHKWQKIGRERVKKKYICIYLYVYRVPDGCTGTLKSHQRDSNVQHLSGWCNGSHILYQNTHYTPAYWWLAVAALIHPKGVLSGWGQDRCAVILEQKGAIYKLFPQSWEHEIVQNVLKMIKNNVIIYNNSKNNFFLSQNWVLISKWSIYVQLFSHMITGCRTSVNECRVSQMKHKSC